MTSGKHYYYFVEGENEKQLINVLKREFQTIPSGRVKTLNVLTHPISNAEIINLQSNSTVIFVFDTDDDSVKFDILYENKRLLKEKGRVKHIYCITQVRNIEDEIVRATDINDIRDLLSSRSKKNFKTAFNRIGLEKLAKKMEEHHFDMTLLWSQQPTGKFSEIRNEMDEIRQKL